MVETGVPSRRHDVPRQRNGAQVPRTSQVRGKAVTRVELLRRLARLDATVEVADRRTVRVCTRAGNAETLRPGWYTRAEVLALLARLRIPAADFDDMR